MSDDEKQLGVEDVKRASRPSTTAALCNPAGYSYDSAESTVAHRVLLPMVVNLLRSETRGHRRVFDLGCGNGAVARHLADLGFTVTGVDPSEQGIGWARQADPSLDLHVGSAYDDLSGSFGRFPIVVSLEVVEHLYFPRKYARSVFDLLEPGGVAIISTPYHGYMKNLALALTNRMDQHFTALWDHGHIKFWSRRTLRGLLEEAGFREISFRRVGRIPMLAMSMIAVARKPR